MTHGVYTLLVLTALGCVAWGKAVSMEKGEVPVEEFSSVETAADNPCVYKGNVFTVDVRKTVSRIK